jgi:hypothetical protein
MSHGFDMRAGRIDDSPLRSATFVPVARADWVWLVAAVDDRLVAGADVPVAALADVPAAISFEDAVSDPSRLTFSCRS